jgi:hypothetical protein
LDEVNLYLPGDRRRAGDDRGVRIPPGEGDTPRRPLHLEVRVSLELLLQKDACRGFQIASFDGDRPDEEPVRDVGGPVPPAVSSGRR